MNDLYSPDTMEHIITDHPQTWMMRAGTPPPDYDRAISGCFWRNEDWEIVVSSPDWAKLKSEAISVIDSAAGIARGRYITIAPGQEGTYLLKAKQAEAYKTAGYAGAVPGLVQAEVDATNETAQQAADTILAMELIWADKAAQIESARRRGKVSVEAARTEIAIDAARIAAVAELDLL